MTRHLKFLLMVMVFLGAALSSFGAGRSASDAFKAYSAALKKYQAAVEQHLPKPALELALKKYQQAREEYLKTLPAAGKASLATGGSKGDPDGDPTGDGGLTSTNGFSFEGVASYPTDLQTLMASLNRGGSPQYTDSIIDQLFGYLATHPDLPDGFKLRYQLAKAIESLKGDRGRALGLYQQVAADPKAGRWGIWAKIRMRYLTALGDKLNWRKSVEQKYAEVNTAWQKYRQTSWLAFPVKIARWVKYLGSSVSFIRAQNEESDFQLWFEELGAPLAPPVTQVFDQYQSGNDPNPLDETARVKLLYGNYQSWYARWKLMSEANRSIDIQYFIIENDAFGLSFLGLILKKAREGVRVRLMVDARGTTKFATPLWARDYLRMMLQLPNVEIKIYNPIQSSLVSMLTDIRRILASNHDKIIVVDGRYAIIGGRNIANEYLTDPVDNAGAWRDCDVVIDSGEVAGALERAFQEEFEILKAYEVEKLKNGTNRIREMDASRGAMEAALAVKPLPDPKQADKTIAGTLQKVVEELRGYKHMTGFPQFEPFQGAHDCPVKILDKHSLSGPRNDITEALVRFIDGSRKEIIIQNPYIVLTPRAEAALKRAAKRGIPIYIHTNSPQTSDSFPTEGIVMREWRDMLKNLPTCRMFARVNEGQLHAKNFVFDRQIGVVGTYNFDYLSEKVNSEVVAAVNSPAFAQELAAEIFFDIKKSKEYHLATADSPEFGPENIESKKMWLVKIASKLGFLKPLF